MMRGMMKDGDTSFIQRTNRQMMLANGWIDKFK